MRWLIVSAAALSGLAAQAGAPASGSADDGSRPPELCASAIDPWDEVEEYVRFRVAAGDDRELSEQEFRANQQAVNPFARPFDHWSNLALFDRGGDGTISWSEAIQYRRRLRRAVLEIYDADGDGQLKDAERVVANRALASGLVLAVEPAPPPSPAAEDRPEPQTQPTEPTTEPTDPQQGPEPTSQAASGGLGPCRPGG